MFGAFPGAGGWPMSPGYPASRPASPSMALQPYGRPHTTLAMSASRGATSCLPPPSLYSPQTPLSPFESQQAQARAQMQAIRLQRQQQRYAGDMYPSQGQMYGYLDQSGAGTTGRPRSGSNAMQHQAADMEAFDDNAGRGAQRYHPRMDNVTAYVRGASPHTSAGPSQHHLQQYPSMQMPGLSPFQNSERFGMSGAHASHLNAEQDYDVEQEVSIKTKLKTRGKGRMHGQGQGSQQAAAHGAGMVQGVWQDPSTLSVPQQMGHLPQHQLQQGIMRNSMQPGLATGMMGFGQDADFAAYDHRAPSPF